MSIPAFRQAEAAVRAFQAGGGGEPAMLAALGACLRLIDDPGFGALSVDERRYAFNCAGVLSLRRFQEGGDAEDLARSVACLEAGIAAAPSTAADVAVFHGNLAAALAERFRLSGDLDDLSRAAHGYEAVIDEAPPEFARTRLSFLLRLVALLNGNAAVATGKDFVARRIKAMAALLDALPPGAEGAQQRGAVLVTMAGALLDWTAHCPLERRAEIVAEADAANREGGELLRAAGDEDGLRVHERISERIQELRPILAHLEEAQQEERTVDGYGLRDQILAIENPALRRAELRKVLAQISPETESRGWVLFADALATDIVNDRTAAPADHDEAIASLEAALPHLDAGEDPEDAARFLHNLALAHTRRAGDGDEHAERAVELYETAAGLAAPGTLIRLQVTAGLADALRVRARGDRARNIERAISLCESTLAGEWADAAGAAGRARRLNQLARLYLARVEGGDGANVEAAIGHLHAAADLLDRDVDPFAWADVRFNLGTSFRRRLTGGREENIWVAISHFRACLEVYRRDAVPVDWADAHVALGNAYGLLRGRDGADTRDRAVAAYLTALEVFTRAEAPPAWGRVQASIGITFADGEVNDTADVAKGIGHLRAALEVLTEANAPQEWAFTQATLGTVLLLHPEEGGADAARAHLEAAMRVFTLNTNPLQWARCRLNLVMGAGTAIDVAAYAAAMEVFEKNAAWSDMHKGAAFMVDALAESGEWAEAARIGEGALKALGMVHGASVLRETRHVDRSAGGRLVDATAVALARSGRPRDAAMVLENWRAHELGEELSRAQAGLARLGDAAPEERAAYEEATERVRAAEELERAVTGGPVSQALVREAEVRRVEVIGALTAARAERAAAVGRIRELPGFAGFLAPPAEGDVLTAARPGHPLAYLCCGPHGGVVLLVSRSLDGGEARIEAHDVPLTRRSLGDLLDGGLLGAQAGAPHVFAAALDRACEVAGRDLAAPLAAVLRGAGAAAVTLVPCGRLAALPVHAAPYGPADGAADGACLIDEFDVRYAPSARVATACAARAAAAPGGRDGGLTGVADPTGDLPYARAEAAALTALVPGGRIRTGAAADRAALSAGTAGASRVHLACHAAFDRRRPLRSALVLAGGERLTLAEILDGRAFAGVRLVVASACTTAVTDDRHPDEAVGLAAGLIQAGAAGVVASLWPVGDLATMLLMTRFYAEPGEDGLRRAQTWLRDATAADVAGWLGELAGRVPAGEGRDILRGARDQVALAGPAAPLFRHPRHWAPFVHLGA